MKKSTSNRRKANIIPRKKITTERGFTLIEVLVAVLILATVISSLNAAFKQYVNYRAKITSYETLYLSVLSLKDYLSRLSFIDQDHGSGAINGLEYRYQIVQQSKTQNYVTGMTEGETGNQGAYEIALYKITVVIAEKSFVFFQTQYVQSDQTVRRGGMPVRSFPSGKTPPSETGGPPEFIY